MIGQKILHYQVIEKLGQGGMGEVYRARDTRLNRDVALKFLPESLRSDADARERLLREAQAASRLHQTNIVSIFAIEDVEGHDFIVMEFVDGRTLSELIREDALPIDKVFNVAAQIGNALQAAHEQGIVHRDIKSENILVTEKGQVKILDFGLAKLWGAARLTHVSSTLGTMAYMSPEQAQGQDVDHRSDLFSFGVVCYEMITGHLPFKGDHSAAITYAIVNSQPEPLARFKSGVPDELQRFIDKALRKEPGKRYQSAADMVADLSELSGISGIRPVARSGHFKGRILAGAAAAVIIIVAGLFALQRSQKPSAVAPPGDARIMLAVLPFDNLGASADEYFADGITEEITTHLSKLSGLGVISRTSAMAYKDTEKTLREIGGELGVDYVLEGTIRWDRSSGESRVRINPQLIKVADDTHLWADSYDRVFSEIFTLQTDIAQKVASALNITLLEPERRAIEAKPTENMEAYHRYLRGKEHFATATSLRDRELASQSFREAVELDSAFASAHAWLARIYANDYFNDRDPDATRLEEAYAHAQQALKYSGGGAEGHLAMGYYHYYGSRDYDEALREFDLAKKGEPNNSALFEASAYVLRRQGRWDEAVEDFRHALEIDPHALNLAMEYSQTLARMRRYDDALAFVEQGLARNPDYWPLYLWRGVLMTFGYGDIDTPKRMIDEAARYAPRRDLLQFREMMDYLSGDVNDALRWRQTMSDWEEGDSVAFYDQRGFLYYAAGELGRAVAYFDSARVMLEVKVSRNPDDYQMHNALALTYAGLGERENALKHGRRSLELMPLSRDAVASTEVSNTMVFVYLMLGDTERALDTLEYLMSIPSFNSRSSLKLDPMLRPLHDHPRFQKLVQGKDNT